MNLGEIADIRSGLVLSRKQARADSPQAIRYHQLSLRAVKAEGEIDPAELEPYFAKEPLSMDYLTQPNDIVVRLTAPYTAVLIDDTTRNLVITSNFVVIRIRGTELMPGYLYWYLNTPKAKRQIYQNTTKSMISSVNARYFCRLELQLPRRKYNARWKSFACWHSRNYAFCVSWKLKSEAAMKRCWNK